MSQKFSNFLYYIFNFIITISQFRVRAFARCTTLHLTKQLIIKLLLLLLLRITKFFFLCSTIRASRVFNIIFSRNARFLLIYKFLIKKKDSMTSHAFIRKSFTLTCRKRLIKYFFFFGIGSKGQKAHYHFLSTHVHVHVYKFQQVFITFSLTTTVYDFY